MKSAIVSIVLVMTGLSAQAADYSCVLTNNQDKEKVKFTFDTATEDNKTVDLGKAGSVGCVVLRSTPQLVSCGFAGETFSIFTTAEDGSSVLGLDTKSGKYSSNLLCKKTK